MRACWLKWVGRDWSISADYIWLNYSGANTAFYNVPCGPDGPGIKFVASSARKEGHVTSMFWT